MKLELTSLMVYVSIAIGMMYGWIMNIVVIFHSTFDLTNLSAILVLRIIGVFVAPLGVVLGYM